MDALPTAVLQNLNTFPPMTLMALIALVAIAAVSVIASKALDTDGRSSKGMRGK